MSEPAHPLSLERVVGRDVSSICFVRDYVQVCFDEFVLTCYTLPTVRMSETDNAFGLGTPAYRGKLCEFIGKCVRSVAEKPDEELAIGFDDGSSINVSLRYEDSKCVEAAMFHELEGRIFAVWRL